MSMSSRLFPTSFRTPLDASIAANNPLPTTSVPLRIRCQCNAFDFTVQAYSATPPVRCACATCRKFHASAFSAFLPLEDGDAIKTRMASDADARTFTSHCDGLGAQLERAFCGRCKSVLGARPRDSTAGFLLALGCVEDASLPPALALAWQSNFRLLSAPPPSWWVALPARRQAPPRVLRGRCACGACAFEAASGDEFQTQQCAIAAKPGPGPKPSPGPSVL